MKKRLFYSITFGSHFLNQATYATGSNPVGIAIIDLNNDGKPDIIVANSISNNIGVFFNAGNGTFLSQITVPIISVSYYMVKS